MSLSQDGAMLICREGQEYAHDNRRACGNGRNAKEKQERMVVDEDFSDKNEGQEHAVPERV